MTLVPVYLGAPKVEGLRDAFESASRDTAKWPTISGTPSQTNGKLVLSADATNYYRSTSEWSLSGSGVFVEVPQVPNVGAGSTYCYLGVGDPSLGDYSLIWNNNTLVFRELGTGATADTSITYDPVAHRWFRLRESAGNILWETSPDGLTWTTRRSKALLSDKLDSVRAQLVAGRAAAETDAGFAHFDNFNALPFSKLSDDFEDGTLDSAKWVIPSLLSGGQATETGGRLRNHFGVPAAGVASLGYYSIMGSEVVIQPFRPGTPKATEGLYLDLVDVDTEGRNRLRFNLIGTTLYARLLLDNVNTGEVSFAYNATDHAWWRIRQTGGNVLWDTSPDGTTWTNRRTTADPFDAHNLQAWIYSNHTGEIQQLRPNADISNPGLWFERPSGSTLAARLSEVTPDDTATEAVRDLRGVTDPTSVAFTVGLSTVLDPFTNTGHTVRVRDRRESGVEVVNFNYRLLEGGAERAAWLRTNANSSYNTTEYTLSAAEADAITDYSALRLEVTATRVDNVTQTNPVVVVTWAEMQVPYSGQHEVDNFNLPPVAVSARRILMVI